MPSSSSYRQKCPRCSGAVKRTRRSSREMRDESTHGMRRYKCSEPDCDWNGLLPRLVHRTVRSGSRLQTEGWKGWLVPLAMLALVAISVAALSFKAMQA
jgi:hypothetical protein